MYQKVLIPLDGSELAECALKHVKNLMHDGSVCEVTLLNVVKVDIPWATDSQYRGMETNINTIREKAFQKSRAYLADVESRLGSDVGTIKLSNQGMPYTATLNLKTESLEATRPGQAIVDYAHNNCMDLIVMATHGYTGMKKMVLGSVALSVLHLSHVPVLIIRPESCQI